MNEDLKKLAERFLEVERAMMVHREEERKAQEKVLKIERLRQEVVTELKKFVGPNVLVRHVMIDDCLVRIMHGAGVEKIEVER